MSNTAINREKTLKCGIVIKILSIISLVCNALACTNFFFDAPIDGDLTFSFPSLLSLGSILLTIAPCVLLTLYIFGFHSKLKATVIVPIILALLPLKMAYHFLFGNNWKSAIFLLLVIVFCTLAVISALKGFNKKVFIIIAMSLCLLYELLDCIYQIFYISTIIDYYHMSYSPDYFLYFFSIIGSCALYIALLLFATKNKIPSIITK